jgi:RimJ/RimL family protein N-acetyltransferase
MINVRVTVPGDAPFLTRWLNDEEILRWFPMMNEREIEDAVNLWVSYAKIGACFTAEDRGRPVGMANLYIQPYKKLAHQCLLSIIVDKEYRSRGIGKMLVEQLIKAGKEQFNLSMLHLEVYEGNPAIRLYERMGFVPFGRQSRFIKDRGEYIGKIMMQRKV